MMSRVPDLSDDDLSPEQRAVVAEAVAGLRGRMPAPMRAWLVSPELARRAQHLGEFLRYQTSLEPRLSELAILVTARFWTSHYEWYAHVDAARAAGVSDEVIEAIRTGQDPDFTAPDEEVVYAVATAVHHDHVVSSDLFERATSTLGEVGTAELVGLLGYYTLVAMTLNVYGIVPGEHVPNPFPA
ncbi:carboxymuconolactone decarboxylase family protein [Saccharomonospora viridis]|jgi:4-carboxymuconolactone decarboxylase|uniref:carboxymuconolactone decarboxylase family protein n=1 Tax=Saccharomonospora viridis TaxID=1852 RepID=UPI0024A8825F|nr:carboxymuconolactone decarboxylase family protein [Saccharomonospora viridis]